MIKTIHDLNGQYFEPDFIKETVLKYFGHKDLSEIDRPGRKQPETYQRQVLQVFLRKKTIMSFEAIGKLFNPAKDHTTVVSAEKKISDLMYSDENVLNDMNAINELLNK